MGRFVILGSSVGTMSDVLCSSAGRSSIGGLYAIRGFLFDDSFEWMVVNSPSG
jgi:hypothetical protein